MGFGLSFLVEFFFLFLLLLLHPFIFLEKRIHVLPRRKQKTVCAPNQQFPKPRRRLWVGERHKPGSGCKLGRQRDTGGAQSPWLVPKEEAKMGPPLTDSIPGDPAGLGRWQWGALTRSELWLQLHHCSSVCLCKPMTALPCCCPQGLV